MAVLRLVPVAGAAIQIDKDQAIVGREPSCDVFVNDGSVSRRHARLERRGAAWFVVDQGSANGTYLESQRVSDALLRPGQELRFGAIPFRVELPTVPGGVEGTMLAPAGAYAPPAPLAPPRPVAPSPLTPPMPVAPGAPQWQPAPSAPPRPAPPGYPPPVEPTMAAPRPGMAPPAAPPRPMAPVPPGPAYAPAPRPAPPAPMAGPSGGPPAGPGTQPYRPPRGPRPPRTPAAEEAPAPGGHGALFWVGMGCGGIVLLALVLGGGFFGFLYYARQGPVNAARAQLQQLHAGQLDQAYDRLAQPYRARVPKERLAAFTAGHPTLKEYADSTFLSWEVSGGTATLAGYLTSSSGVRETVSYELVKEGGDWKVARLEVAGDHPDTPVSAGPTGLRFESVEARKGPSADGNVVVRLSISVAGFEVRPQGDQFLMDLSLDVETLDPAGQRVEALSRAGVLKVQRPTSLGKGAVAPIETALTLDSSMPQGDYTIVLRIHDDFGGTQAEHRATVAMP